MTDPTPDPADARTARTPGNGGPPESAPLVSTSAADRCSGCGSALSADQRYCVVCGERRGAARFTAPAAPPAPGIDGAAESPMPIAAGRGGRLGAGLTIVAGVFTLLLAMLIGVLIGHSTGSGVKTIASQPRPIIKVVDSGSSAPAASAPSTVTSGSTSASTGGSGRHAAKASHHTAAKQPSKAAAAKQSAAAAKVTGGTHTVPSTQTIGSSCSSGTAGCNPKTHKQDGSFFGG